MGPVAIIIGFIVGGCGLWHYLTLPNGTIWTNNMGFTVMFFTIIFVLSAAGLIVWNNEVREFYLGKKGLVAWLIKIITFPIWLFNVLTDIWASYQVAKGVRNWMHKND